MAPVGRSREELPNLGSQWDLLTILGQMSGTGTDMAGTREGFQHLASELLGQPGLETLKKTWQALGAKAQVAMDIVIRNLFERANDCRWWALTTAFRRILAQPHRTSEDMDSISAILAYKRPVHRLHHPVRL